MQTDRLTHEVIEDERYELLEEPSYWFEANRREFVQVLGAGLVIAVSSRAVSAQRPGGRRRRRGGEPAKISQRFHIGTDGMVTVMTGKVEVGQGSRTQVTQAVAEELRVPLGQIRAIMGDTQLCPNDGGTSGSSTTPRTIRRVRAAAAAARELLAELGAEKLQTDRSSVTVQDGKVIHNAAKKEITFAKLAEGEDLASRLDVLPPEGVSVRRVREWVVMGTPVGQVNAEHVVTGQLRYPSDVVRPGVLYGKILRPPSYGAAIKSVDLTPAEAMEGITALRDGQFIGCAAESSWQAQKAIEAIAATAQWDSPPPQPSSAELFQYLKSHVVDRTSGFPRPRSSTWGTLSTGLAAAERVLSASYEVAYIQHVPMEPRAAVAEWNDGNLTVWTGTQNPMRVRSELARVFRMGEDRVRVIVPDTGGGFGGKHTGEVGVEAARLAKAAGRPVSVRWTREEEFTWAYFRPAGLIEVRAGLGADGKLVAWDFTNYNSGGSAINTPYEVPHGRTQFVACDSPLRQGSYRALAATANTFAREAAMDELARVAGVDPLRFRREHLPQGRLRDVLEAAAQRFQWDRRKKNSSPRHAVGLACGIEKASYVAACVEVEVDQGQIKVRHICQAYECGAIQNPTNLRAQVEGCIIMGLGGALTEEIQFENGQISNASLSSYLVPRMADVPEIDTVLVDRPDLDSVGAGETPIIAVAPAIANAVFAATGVPVRSMPLRSPKVV